MKRLFSTLVLPLFFLALMTNTGCSKGDAGPAGATGPAGSTGPVGPAGANGSVIYSGTTTPPAATGNVGDFYLNLSTGLLYGPKTASGWGSGISLVGATGAAGAAGTKIYNGNGAPLAATGAIGDFYLDQTNYLLYGPRTASGWGTGLSLKGTANVIYSNWNYATNYRDTIIDGSKLKVANLQAQELTSAYLSNATILVYFTFGSGIYPTPYTSNAGGAVSTLSFLPQLGNILITRFTADNSGSVPLSTSLEFRFVIIPGGVNVPNKFDYETLSHFYGIPIH